MRLFHKLVTQLTLLSVPLHDSVWNRRPIIIIPPSFAELTQLHRIVLQVEILLTFCWGLRLVHYFLTKMQTTLNKQMIPVSLQDTIVYNRKSNTERSWAVDTSHPLVEARL